MHWLQESNYFCRIDQVGAGLVQLLTVDFIVSKAIMITMPYVNKLKAKITSKEFKKEEFMVAKKMVNILYSQGLVFAALPYAPLFTVVILVFHFCTFKFEKFMLFKFGSKPKKEVSCCSKRSRGKRMRDLLLGSTHVK